MDVAPMERAPLAAVRVRVRRARIVAASVLGAVATFAAATFATAIFAGATFAAGPAATPPPTSTPVTGTPAAPAIAAEGFGRPMRLATVAAGEGAQVAVAGGRGGPIAVWEDAEGLMARPLDGGEPERLLEAPGVRALWAGEAGGDPLVAWLERDLNDGSMKLSWRWRDETRTVLRSDQRPRARLVAGASGPELVTAVPAADGWRIALHDWDGGRRTSSPRGPTVAGIDAVRVEDAVAVSWLEGSNEVVLGRLDGAWTAYLATWSDGADRPGEPEALGPARRRGDGDVTRASVGPDARVEVAWPEPSGALRAGGPGAPGRALGHGTVLGRPDGAWTWVDGSLVRQAGTEGVRTVLRLPAAPEHAALARADGVTGIVWSSGRYLGGLEVWGVTDRVPYRASWIERLALTMGWDPWRPWSAAGGHLLVSVLAALLLAVAATPAWWLGAALTSLLARPATSRAIAIDGTLLGVGSVLAASAVVAAGAARVGAVSASALTGGPGLLVAGAALGAAAAWAMVARRDLEATFGRLLAAWTAGSVMLLVLAFGTLTEWQRLFGAAS